MKKDKYLVNNSIYFIRNISWLLQLNLITSNLSRNAMLSCKHSFFHFHHFVKSKKTCKKTYPGTCPRICPRSCPRTCRRTYPGKIRDLELGN